MQLTPTFIFDNRWPPGWAACFVLLLSALTNLAGAQPAAESASPILEYQRELSLVAEQDNAIQLQVFADGRVLLHYPAFMRRAGDYELWLEAAELKRLMTAMRSSGMTEFDPVATRTAVRQADQAATRSGQLRLIRSDADITHLRMQTERGSHAFSYQGVKGHVQRHPEIEGLQQLWSALQRLDQLMRDPGFKKLTGATP